MTRILSLFVMIACLLPAPGGAQTLQEASAEDVAIAFYKTAGLTPKYSELIPRVSPYRDTPQARRTRVLEAEKYRLAAKWRDFKPGRSALVIRTPATLTLYGGEAGGALRGYGLKLGEGEADYFLYEYAGHRFALIPLAASDKLKGPLDADAAAGLEALLNGRVFRASAVLRLVPVDAKTGFRVRAADGELYWPLGARIAGVTLYDRGEMLWELPIAREAPSLLPPGVKGGG